jgi:hypothetical protein
MSEPIAVIPMPAWRRPRASKRFSAAVQRIFASSMFWASLPKKSILNMPGNKWQPKPLGDKFQKGPLRAASVIQKFYDKRGKGFARLSTGTVVATGDFQPTTV